LTFLPVSGSRDVIGHVPISLAIGHFVLVILWIQASISNGFRDFQWRMWRDGWHDLKRRPLNKVQGHDPMFVDFWHRVRHILYYSMW